MNEHPCDMTRSMLEGFERIALEDMPVEVLMERVDRKFPFHVSRIGEVLKGLEGDFFVLEAAGDVISPYETLYFDTEDMRFYNDHQRGVKNRMKIRYRSYPKTQAHFLEIKRKNNKSQTSKERVIVSNSLFPFPKEASEFLRENVAAGIVDDLRPTVRIFYNRLAFIEKNFNERFSIDFEVHFETEHACGKFQNLAIAEIKQANYRTTDVVRHFRRKGLQESSMSKYCLSLATLQPNLKSGTFKPVLRKIQKITHAA